MSTTTNLDNLVINYLTQAQYATALANNQIDEDQLYFTPSSQLSSTDVTTALGYTPATNSHTHGDITNTGDITATAPTIASGDKLIINDQSANKVTNGPSFGTSTTQYLANNGTWQNVPDISGKIDTAGTGLSKSGTTLNHSNSVIAQTTQAVYPIKIDAQGHISNYGTAVNIPVQNFWYGTCDTAAATQAKEVTTVGGDFVLTTGSMIRVKFTNAQTYDGGITLNVDNTGAVACCVMGTSVTQRYFYRAGEVVDFVYDGTNFTQLDGANASTTYYGNTKLSDSINSTSVSLAATPNAVKQAYDLANSKQDALISGTNIKTINNESLLGSGNISVQGGGGTQNVWYGTCGTAANTQAKVVTTVGQNFTLTTGNMIRVKFTNAYSYNGAITLNVDGTGAVGVKAYGTTDMPRYWFYKGEVIDFVYDGSNYVTVRGAWAGTTYYGNTKLTSSTSSTSTTLAATADGVKTAYDHAGVGGKTVWWAPSTTMSPGEFFVTTSSGDFEYNNGNMVIIRFTQAATYQNNGWWLYIDNTSDYTNIDLPYAEQVWSAGSVIGFVYDSTSDKFVPVFGL